MIVGSLQHERSTDSQMTCSNNIAFSSSHWCVYNHKYKITKTSSQRFKLKSICPKYKIFQQEDEITWT